MNEVLNLMKTTGAILEGHFKLSSGRHSDVYLEKFRLLERPEVMEKIGQMMAKPFEKKKVDLVLGAAVGGILLSNATARVIGTKGIFAERVNGRLMLRRGFELTSEQEVLLVEDIVTTGGSVRELIEVVDNHGATIAGVVCMIDRTEDGIDFGYSTTSLLRYPAISWEPDSCPLCKKAIPFETRGRSGKK